MTRRLLATRVLALGLVMGSVLVGCADGPVPASPVASQSLPSTSPSSLPSAAAGPTATDAPAPPAEDHAPLIVYRYGAEAVELFTLDAFTGEQAPMGRIRRAGQVTGQSIHWSADRRSAFVYGDTDSVSARIDVASGSVHAVRIPPTVSRDAVSPAGDVIARLTDQNDIELVNPNGRRIRVLGLPNGITPLLRIVWSPDGTVIAASACLPCVDKRRGNWHAFLAPVNGDPVRQVGQIDTSSIGIDDWSPDASRILYENSVSGEAGAASVGIAVLDLATGTATQLTTTGESAASWSPDGLRIVFDSGFGGSELSVIDSDGAAASRHVLATSEPGFGFDDPIWSPNGDWILYRVIPMKDSSQTGIGDLWMVPSAGGEPRLVVKDAIADW